MNRNPLLQAAWRVGLLLTCVSCVAAETAEKVYVALEGEGAVAVVDPLSRQVVHRIDLTETVGAESISRAPHNVQVAPDGKSVWVTANAQGHHGHAGEAQESGAPPSPDQVIVIDPVSDVVVRRIDVAPMAHLSHVVVAPDGKTAFVNAQNLHRIYRIDTSHGRILGFTGVAGLGPHGMRLSPDGRQGFLAMLDGRSLGILDAQTGGMTVVPLGGAAVQAGITADGRTAVASVYDTKQVALYDVASRTLAYVDLPGDAKGPVQLYPTPDSRFLYVADQGVYFGQPAGDRCYKLDLAGRRVIKAIPAGHAPHGVVVSADGKFVYLSNLLSDDVSVIDTRSDVEVARIPVGREPNGISAWSAQSGGTP
ncbi:Vgb family protein [Methylolobus aquaticus]